MNEQLLIDLHNAHATIEQRDHQIKLLAEAIGAIALADGLVDGSVPMTGPGVLMLADSVADALTARKVSGMRYLDNVAALIADIGFAEGLCDDCVLLSDADVVLLAGQILEKTKARKAADRETVSGGWMK